MDALVPIDTPFIEYNHLESLFTFSMIWSFGAALAESDRGRFYRWIRENTAPPMLSSTNCYDLCFDFAEKQWIPWERKVMEFVPPSCGTFSKMLVPTVDTVRYAFLLEALVSRHFPCLFVGEPGTAKTVIINNYLSKLDLETQVVLGLNFSSRTSSLEVQKNIESVTDRRRPGLWGPKSNKKLVIFVDELHMPTKDTYNTQEPIALLKFLIDKGYMYERGGALELRLFKDIDYIAALLPPGGGYNSVDPRFLSLFNTINIIFPNKDNIEKIYNTILRHHLKDFPQEIKDLTPKITQATLQIYLTICEKLPRTPIKFHYIFNLRDLSKVYQGLARSTLQEFSKKEDFLRLWRNETLRSFYDRLISFEDRVLVNDETISAMVRDHFGPDQVEATMKDPILYGDFMKVQPLDPNFEDPKVYQALEDFVIVKKKCDDMLGDYNDDDPSKEMSLVLFDDALDHMIKLIRILKFPKGHALLVGFGGSGKQSLSKLSIFMSCLEIFQINLKRNYKEENFKEDLIMLYDQVVQKETAFLFTDAQIAEESFVELINTMLTVGVITSLVDSGKKAEYVNVLRDKCKKAGRGETADEIWQFCEDTIRNNLHIVLCMSPAGDKLRLRSRNFPGLVSSTSIDWFFQWPESALSAVAIVYLQDVELKDEETRVKIIDHFTFVHSSIPAYSAEYEKVTKRKNFSTPKNYLGFLNAYKDLLTNNRTRINDTVVRYTNGLIKLDESKRLIESLQAEITIEKEKVNAEKEIVEELIVNINAKKEIVEVKAGDAGIKKEKLDIDSAEIKKASDEADAILKEAEPELAAAQEKVKLIQKKDLDYIKALASPSPIIQQTVSCLQVLKVNDNANENDGWVGAKAMLGDMKLVDKLLDFGSRISSVRGNQYNSIKEKKRSIMAQLDAKGVEMGHVSPACGFLMIWINSVISFYETNKKVEPLKANVKVLEAKLIGLTAE